MRLTRALVRGVRSAFGRTSRLPERPLLHVGCGLEALPGWVNVDIEPFSSVDVVADVTRGLQFANCRAVFAEHFLSPTVMGRFPAFPGRYYMAFGGGNGETIRGRAAARPSTALPSFSPSSSSASQVRGDVRLVLMSSQPSATPPQAVPGASSDSGPEVETSGPLLHVGCGRERLEGWINIAAAGAEHPSARHVRSTGMQGMQGANLLLV